MNMYYSKANNLCPLFSYLTPRTASRLLFPEKSGTKQSLLIINLLINKIFMFVKLNQKLLL
jgi:hypothetical protein